MLMKYVVKKKCFGFRGRIWNKDAVVEADPSKEKIPSHFEPIGKAAPAAGGSSGKNAPADAEIIKSVVDAMKPEEKAAYEKLSAKKKAEKDKEILAAAGK
jgi:hypothetical protein